MARKGRGGGDVSDTGNATSHPGAVSTVDLKKKMCTTFVHFSVILYLIELPRGLNCYPDINN